MIFTRIVVDIIFDALNHKLMAIHLNKTFFFLNEKNEGFHFLAQSG